MAKKTKFSPFVLNQVRKVKLDRLILQSDTPTPNFTKEIKRVFQVANRRIQNIKNSKNEILSPAFEALNMNTDKYSVFRVGGKDWNELKILYSRAVNFIQNPTSTATGARQYTAALKRDIQDKYGLDNQQVSKVIKAVKEGVGVGAYDFTLGSATAEVFDEYINDSQTLANQLEKDHSAPLEDAINKDIALLTDKIQQKVNEFQDDIQNMLDGLKY